MDLKNLALFKMTEQKIQWLNQRQSVLARNIANADTPGYMPSDLRDVSFKSTLMDSEKKVRMSKTNEKHVSEGGVKIRASMTDSSHMPGTVPERGAYRVDETRKPYELSVDENAVVLEDQMVKMSETRGQHDLAVTLFKKNLKMIRSALGNK